MADEEEATPESGLEPSAGDEPEEESIPGEQEAPIESSSQPTGGVSRPVRPRQQPGQESGHGGFLGQLGKKLTDDRSIRDPYGRDRSIKKPHPPGSPPIAKKTPQIVGKVAKGIAGGGLGMLQTGGKLGWSGMKAVLGNFMTPEEKERLEKIEQGVGKATQVAQDVIDKPRQIAQTIDNTRRAIQTAVDLPRRLKEAHDILRGATGIKDYVNAFNVLRGAPVPKAIVPPAAPVAAAPVAAAPVAAAPVAAVPVTAAPVVAAPVVVAPVAATPVVVTAAAPAAAATWPVWVIVLIIILGFVVFILIFMGVKSYVTSKAGGSYFTPPTHSAAVPPGQPATPITEEEALVERLQKKLAEPASDPVLVVYSQGENDLKWQQDASGLFSHKLDIRLLKTIDYLTDKHRIKIGLLKTGGPDLLVEDFLSGLNPYNPDQAAEGYTLPANWDTLTTAERRAFINALPPDERAAAEQAERKETISAFATGQAMAILEIDRSTIKQLQATDRDENGNSIAPPISMGWQRTVLEKLTRPTWEELAFSAGALDKNIIWLKGMNQDSKSAQKAIEGYQFSVEKRFSNSTKEVFRKLKRISELLARMQTWDNSVLHPDTLRHFKNAADSFKKLNDILDISDVESWEIVKNIPTDKLVAALQSLGSANSITTLQDGIKEIYKGTQVANMVGWDSGDLDYLKAYEARNKIREVIKELMAMPNQTTLDDTVDAADPLHFDDRLVVKQIITFSPEDDLDNGLEGLDVFPFGIDGVGIGGISMNPSGKDGRYSYEDLHFSHAPIDNGVFSKHGTNWVYTKDNPPDFSIVDLFKEIGDAIGEQQRNRLSGGTTKSPEVEIDETLVPITYQKFLYVAF